MRRPMKLAVAYHYRAGLRGFQIDRAKRVVWRDVARGWQKVEFGGSPNTDPVALRARNRLAIVESDAARLPSSRRRTSFSSAGKSN